MEELDKIEKRLVEDYQKVKERIRGASQSIKKEIRRNKGVAKDLKENAEKALDDLQTGRVFTDDNAVKNLRNTVTDVLKAAGMTGIFMLPGGSVGLIALRKMLKSEGAQNLGIQNLLTLTVEATEKKEEDQKDKLEEE